MINYHLRLIASISNEKKVMWTIHSTILILLFLLPHYSYFFMNESKEILYQLICDFIHKKYKKLIYCWRSLFTYWLLTKKFITNKENTNNSWVNEKRGLRKRRSTNHSEAFDSFIESIEIWLIGNFIIKDKEFVIGNDYVHVKSYLSDGLGKRTSCSRSSKIQLELSD